MTVEETTEHCDDAEKHNADRIEKLDLAGCRISYHAATLRASTHLLPTALSAPPSRRLGGGPVSGAVRNGPAQRSTVAP
ncbi:hypothetical protein GCM10010326_76780 [Streptomyces xanthochromogenes]|uniref:Uncharacterized protein n=1 Tax=Streptomyces xanthochromogenes TaxID=67384 RepID=A0ABQ3B1N7_9ACTN|nr:hypothetical protein GCM10010326_76780 [Streptomyces xanthochromogenes]